MSQSCSKILTEYQDLIAQQIYINLFSIVRIFAVRKNHMGLTGIDG